MVLFSSGGWDRTNDQLINSQLHIFKNFPHPPPMERVDYVDHPER